MLYVAFKIYFINAWDPEAFIVRVNNRLTTSITKGLTYGGESNICMWEHTKE